MTAIPHPDADVLAEFHAGLISGRRGARIAGHLAGCDRCTALSGQLAEVSAVLAAVPAPPMPQVVAHRLDNLLAAEAGKRDFAERARGDSSPGNGSRHRRGGQRGFRFVALRVLAPAAAVLVLAAGGYGLSRLAGGPSSQTGAASSSVASSAAAGGRGPAASRAASSRAQAPAYGAVPADSGPPSAKPQLKVPRRFIVVAGSVDYARGTLRRQVTAEIRASVASPRPPVTPSKQVTSCVRLVTGGVNPVFVERARFEGQPATIIVVPGKSGDVAWVTGAACSATDKDVLARTTLPPGI